MGTEIRVVTYNIHHGVGADGRLDLDRIADVIDRREPDLVGLQEVDRGYRDATSFADQLSILADRLGMESAFGPALERSPESTGSDRRGAYGVGVLGRHPIVESTAVPLPYDAEEERRVLLKTRVDLEGGPEIAFCSTHLGLSATARERQAATVVDALDGDSMTVVVGDFNATPGSPPLEVLTDDLDDAFERSGRAETPTYPTPYVEAADGPGEYDLSVPDRRIDYVLCSSEFAVETVDVVESLASDHSLVAARLSVPE